MIKKALLFFGLVLSMLTVCAEENVLQSIEIVPVKDTYNIVLSADKSVDVKKNVKAPNKIVLDMKGIRASKTLNTIYNNAGNVDSVMVENTSNGLSIFFQADNAQDASITFDAITTITSSKPSEEKQKVKLSSPIDSYAPIYREDLAQEKTSSLFNKITQKSANMTPELQDNASDMSDTLNKVFSYGLVGLLAFGIIKLFKRREPEMKIGLSQGVNTADTANANVGISPMTSPMGTFQAADKPFTTVNYGLNAYKKENQNPYEDEPVHFHNPRLQQYVSPLLRNQQLALQRQLAQSRQNTATATVTMPNPQPVKKHTTPVNTAPVNQGNPNIDNLKFLESMTAIYEKSGRHDLAQGLKASLSKNNIKE